MSLYYCDLLAFPIFREKTGISFLLLEFCIYKLPKSNDRHEIVYIYKAPMSLLQTAPVATVAPSQQDNI